MTDVDRTPLGFDELLARPGVVETVELRGPVGICAFHGGNLERATELIATEAARRAGASCYTVTQPEGMRHHIPSADVDPGRAPRFAAFLAHCDHVIAVHGYGRHGHFTSLLCGGGNRPMAAHVAGHLRNALPYYRVVDDLDQIPRRLRGVHPANPCNLTSGGGVQVELPPRVRGLTPLARYWPGGPYPPDRFPHALGVIDGLAAAAATWPV
ncbi:MAG: poly-gamma-glutamate hydrolase family protein [Acidimicrobiales bacterium]